MPTPQSTIDELNRILHGGSIDYLRNAFAFAVAESIVEFRDADLLSRFPPWVAEMVEEMCESYRQHGQFGLVSSQGVTDKSAMVDELAKLLDARH